MSRTIWAVTAVLAMLPAIAAAQSRSQFQQTGWPRLTPRQSQCCPSYEDGAPSGDVTAPMETAPDEMPEAPQDSTPIIEPPVPADTVDLPSFSNLALAEQGMGGGAGTTILGRADALNRFNLFDNMGAEPMTRVWVAFQAIEGLNTNVVGNPALGRPNQFLYRFGMEYAFSGASSLAAQGMYNDTSDTGEGIGELEASWSNPQFMFKRVMHRNCCSTVAATLGFVPQVNTLASSINESFSRLQPGVIVFRDLGDDRFVHAGMQLNVPLEGNATTSADWVISLGKWLYRHESLDGCDEVCCLPWVLGMTAQVEALGKHVTGDTTISSGFFVNEALDDPSGGPQLHNALQTFDLEEARHVIDITVGTNVQFSRNTSLGLGYSFPITDSEVRRGEFIVSYNIFL